MIVTNTQRLKHVGRTIKDLEYTKKEIARQEERIQEYKDASDRDEHDVKKQVCACSLRAEKSVSLWELSPLAARAPLSSVCACATQMEVLAEIVAGVTTEVDQLYKYLNLLRDIIVRRSAPGRGLTRLSASASSRT